MKNKWNEVMEKAKSELPNMEEIKAVLKKEFVGIDQIIDEVTEVIVGWQLFKGIQKKPVILNLWGLTGTGKTSVILRLLQLLDMESKLYQADLSNEDGDLSFKELIKSLSDQKPDESNIILLDEFQHAKTRLPLNNGKGYLDIPQKDRQVWEFLDTGLVKVRLSKKSVYLIYKTIHQFTSLLLQGVEVKAGRVTKLVDSFKQEYKIETSEKNPLFIQDDILLSILDVRHELSIDGGIVQIRKELSQMNGQESLDYLKQLYRQVSGMVTRSFKNSLIIVIGNLDEAYAMSDDTTADITADIFHDWSQKINVSDIKSALLKSFRPEQVARLGNCHLIYPAFSQQQFFDIIRLKIELFKKEIHQKMGIDLVLTPEYEQTIYDEGVFPTQGVRPILTTIQQLVNDQLASFLNYAQGKAINFDTITFKPQDQAIQAIFTLKGKIQDQHFKPYQFRVVEQKKSKKDDNQATVAVHESGHAVVCMALMNRIPSQVLSTSSSSGYNGVMVNEIDLENKTKSEIIASVATLLAGNLAEKLIFGREYVREGSRSDIKKATQLVGEAIKKQGLGPHLRCVAFDPESFQNIFHEQIEEENLMKLWLDEAKVLAEKTLRKEKKLLIALSKKLADDSSIQQDELREFLYQYGVGPFQIGQKHPYRKILLNQIHEPIEWNGKPLLLNQDKSEIKKAQ